MSEVFDRALKSAEQLAQKAEKKGMEIWGATKLKMKMLEITREIESNYKELGKIAYTKSEGFEVSDESAELICSKIKALNNQLNELKIQSDTVIIESHFE